MNCFLKYIFAGLFAGVLLLASDVVAQDKPQGDDFYKVPEDNIPALLAFIEKLEGFEPADVAEFFAYKNKAPKALQQAAQRIVDLEKDKSSAAYRKAMGILLVEKLQTLGELPADQQEKIIGSVIAYLNSQQELSGSDVQLAMSAGEAAEYSGNRELGRDTYRRLAEIVRGTGQVHLADLAQMMAGASRRLDLIGKPFELTGQTLDGKPFDLAQWKGKVVLVDFWATWCAPCIEEFPNIQENYAKYHDQGFEVVGISLDEERQDVVSFLEQKKLPWQILHDSENEGQHPATIHYGIFGLPALFLIDKQGKVVSLNPRGEELGRLLSKLL